MNTSISDQSYHDWSRFSGFAVEGDSSLSNPNNSSQGLGKDQEVLPSNDAEEDNSFLKNSESSFVSNYPTNFGRHRVMAFDLNSLGMPE